MSGTISLPDTISFSTPEAPPEVTLASATPAYTLPDGVPPYPLAADPAQTWSLQDVNGVLTWVQYALPPGQGSLLLEDGLGCLLLEDGAGALLMEQ